jgi:hypothetical protein
VKENTITTVLPPLYAKWMDDLLRSPIPHETRATCDDCAMCAPEGERSGNGTLYFSPVTKCCTYQPKLPNYLVGRALEDPDFAFSAGRKTLEKRIDDGVGVTPLGLQQSAVFDVLYRNGSDAFGRASALRCPHYLEEAGGRCGVWRHRNSICATWFCKHERGALGLAFWHRMRDLLMAIETALSTWCVLESDLEPESQEALFPGQGRPGSPPSLSAADMDLRVEPQAADRLWGRWRGRERDFYRECAARVTPLTWQDVAEIGGSEVAVRARMTQLAFATMSSERVPDRLAPAAFHVIASGAEGVRVVGYSGTDPLDLDPAVLEVLPYFDGGPAQRALAAIEKGLHVRVEEDLIRRLVDFEILSASKPDRS